MWKFETISKIEWLKSETACLTIQADNRSISSFGNFVFGFVSNFGFRNSCFPRFGEKCGLAAFSLAGFALLLNGCSMSGPSDVPETPYQPMARLSTPSFLIGEPVELSVVVTHESGATVVMESPAVDDVVMVPDFSRAELPLDDGRRLTRLTYTITSLVPGQHTLPAVPIRFTGNTERSPARLPTLEIDVQSSLQSGDTDIRSAKPLARWPPGIPRWIMGLTVVALLPVTAGLVSRHLPRHRPPRARSAPSSLPPQVVARNALANLRVMKFVERREFDPLYVELSAILREYIGERFGVHAPERTTEEFLQEVSTSRALTPEEQHQCRAFMAQCDRGKFARHAPQSGEVHASFYAVESFIDSTCEPGEVAA
jgi:hypothetical protein